MESDDPARDLPPETLLRAAEDRGLMLQPDGAGFAAYLEGEPVDDELRSLTVTSRVSAVSAIPVVREWINSRLRAMVRAGQNVVVDGRDIGTVVFPDADLKIFLTASPEARAGRRISQRGRTIETEDLDAEAAALAARDHADSTRAVAPLRPAHDAVHLDTTTMGFAEQVQFIVERAQSVFSRH
jgi:cytidylate kinase